MDIKSIIIKLNNGNNFEINTLKTHDEIYKDILRNRNCITISTKHDKPAFIYDTIDKYDIDNMYYTFRLIENPLLKYHVKYNTSMQELRFNIHDFKNIHNRVIVKYENESIVQLEDFISLITMTYQFNEILDTKIYEIDSLGYKSGIMMHSNGMTTIQISKQIYE